LPTTRKASTEEANAEKEELKKNNPIDARMKKKISNHMSKCL